jgi:hypothetical protein
MPQILAFGRSRHSAWEFRVNIKELGQAAKKEASNVEGLG